MFCMTWTEYEILRTWTMTIPNLDFCEGIQFLAQKYFNNPPSKFDELSRSVGKREKLLYSLAVKPIMKCYKYVP